MISRIIQMFCTPCCKWHEINVCKECPEHKTCDINVCARVPKDASIMEMYFAYDDKLQCPVCGNGVHAKLAVMHLR